MKTIYLTEMKTIYLTQISLKHDILSKIHHLTEKHFLNIHLEVLILFSSVCALLLTNECWLKLIVLSRENISEYVKFADFNNKSIYKRGARVVCVLASVTVDISSNKQYFNLEQMVRIFMAYNKHASDYRTYKLKLCNIICIQSFLDKK